MNNIKRMKIVKFVNKCKPALAFGGTVLFMGSLYTGIKGIGKWDKRVSQEAKEKNYFVLDIRKSGSGKYYNPITLHHGPKDNNSIRLIFYNLDDNPNTTEHYLKYVAVPNVCVWNLVENLVVSGFEPHGTASKKNLEEMTKEEQMRVNKEFQHEKKYFEPDIIVYKPKKEYKRKCP